MNLKELTAELRTARFRITADLDGLIVAERPVAGMPGHYRICSANLAGPTGEHCWAQLEATRPAEYQRGKIRRERMPEHSQLGGPFLDALAFASWLGGCCSKPISDAERAALSAPAPRFHLFVVKGGPVLAVRAAGQRPAIFQIKRGPDGPNHEVQPLLRATIEPEGLSLQELNELLGTAFAPSDFQSYTDSPLLPKETPL